MVARRRSMAGPPLNPTHLTETILKIDRCIARLQQLRSTVSSSSSTSSSSSSSLSAKKNQRPSPSHLEWREASLKAMLVAATMAEIVSASSFARKPAEPVTSSKKIIRLQDVRPPGKIIEKKEAALPSKKASPPSSPPWKHVRSHLFLVKTPTSVSPRRAAVSRRRRRRSFSPARIMGRVISHLPHTLYP